MKETFTKWYSAHDISGNEARLKSRLELLKTAAKDKDAPRIFDYFNFVLNLNIDDQSVSDYLSKKVKEYEGEEFIVSKSELTLLSFSMILYFSQGTDWTDKLKTNLVLRILSFQKELPSKLTELVATSSDVLIQMSTSSRTARYSSTALKKETDALSQAFNENGNIGGQGAMILKTVQALSTAIGQLSSDISAIREENQLLWWLKSMHLESIDQKVTEIPAANRIVCCAYDLCQKTAYYAVPTSAPQFIVEAFLFDNIKESNKPLSVKSLVEGLDIELAAKVLGRFEDELDEYKHFYPLINALKTAHDYSKDKNQNSTKLPPKADVLKLSLSAEEAAELALCEIMLVKLENE